jgi:hypothetical protein
MQAPATVPRGLTVRVIQTEIQTISNNFNTVQSLFDPKKAFLSSKFFK